MRTYAEVLAEITLNENAARVRSLQKMARSAAREGRWDVRDECLKIVYNLNKRLRP